jgi:hypothetical protein
MGHKPTRIKVVSFNRRGWGPLWRDMVKHRDHPSTGNCSPFTARRFSPREGPSLNGGIVTRIAAVTSEADTKGVPFPSKLTRP